MIIERNAVFIVQPVLRFQGDVMSQLSFSDVEYGAKRKKIMREIFLAEIDSVVPWDSMIRLIEQVSECVEWRAWRNYLGRRFQVSSATVE